MTMALHRIVLALLVAVATMATVTAVRADADRSLESLIRWGVLYVVAVVVPCGWSLYHARRGRDDGRLAAAPAYVGVAVLLASLSLVRPAQEGALLLAIWTALALAVAMGVTGVARWARGGRRA